MNIRKHIPNSITALNVVCGCVALYFATIGAFKEVALFVFLAALFDFMDGMVARLLKAYSELGKQLDSLADMVSFGVVPGFTVYALLCQILNVHPIVATSICDAFQPERLIPFVGFLIPVFSALRLAKFNIDTRQSESFIGLPTPANTLFFVSLALYYTLGNNSSTLFQFLFSSWVPITIITLLMSYLLVAELPMFSLKIKHLNFKDNKTRIFFLLILAIAIIIWKIGGFVFMIPLYIIISVVENGVNRKQNKQKE